MKDILIFIIIMILSITFVTGLFWLWGAMPTKEERQQGEEIKDVEPIREGYWA